MGGVYFASLYHFFGVDPFPCHVVTTALLLLNTFLAYRFGRQITGSQLIGGLTALATTYHARMAQTVYLPTFVFDVLCFTFYFLALTYYLSIRARGVLPTWRQTIAFLLVWSRYWRFNFGQIRRTCICFWGSRAGHLTAWERRSSF
jgi:hypothetical protein